MTRPGGRSKAKTRLDVLLVERGLAPSRAKAQALIMAGEIEVDGQVERRADRGLPADAQLAVRERFPYVSRGALKIERAIADFGLP
ncbi:MAG TPA: S4 domain-containing protein, partial [Candidatus Aminicenantes bacterium]|nr:S4 domain-containing protein [Candidatus Aminicenantes bacterium]